MWLPRLYQGLHQELSPQGSSEITHGWKALRLLVGRLHVAICSLWRANKALPKAYWSSPVQMQFLRAYFCSFRSPHAASEETYYWQGIKICIWSNGYAQGRGGFSQSVQDHPKSSARNLFYFFQFLTWIEGLLPINIPHQNVSRRYSSEMPNF